MQADYHIHTPLCGHAKGRPEEYVAAAIRSGIDEICFTDHAPDPNGYDPDNRMSINDFAEYRDMVFSAQKTENIKVLYGIEADFYEGCEEFLPKWLKEQEFDLVLGSVHYIGNWGFDDPQKKSMWDTADVTASWRRYFELLTKLAQTGFYDVIAHLDLPKKFGHRPSEDDILEMARPALQAIASSGMSIELNTSGLIRPVKEIYPSLMLLKMARECDITICFGSDSHMPDHVGYCFDKSLSLAKQAGYTHCARYRARKKIMTPLD